MPTTIKILFALLCFLSTASAVYAKWPTSIWDPLFLTPHHVWHPPLVAFPIVLIMLEFGTLILFQIMRRPGLNIAAKYFLYLAALMLIPTIIAGLHDVGVDQSPNNAIVAGLYDRIQNFTNFKDALSIHVFYASMLDSLIVIRLIWRRWFYNPEVYAQRIAFLASSAISSWLVFAIGQVGGGMVY